MGAIEIRDLLSNRIAASIQGNSLGFRGSTLGEAGWFDLKGRDYYYISVQHARDRGEGEKAAIDGIVSSPRFRKEMERHDVQFTGYSCSASSTTTTFTGKVRMVDVNSFRRNFRPRRR